MSRDIKSIILHGILPAFLLALSVGQIYAFTVFSSDISSMIGQAQTKVQFAFSLGIFFLGMGAAFFGRFVENEIKKSAAIGISLFISGLLLTIISIKIKSIALLYIGYGLLLGMGTGIIYITPVKTMMMWMPNHKAVASALPIIFFGLGSSFTALVHSLLASHGIIFSLSSFLCIYLAMMTIGGLLLKKPIAEGAAVTNAGEAENEFTYQNLVKTPFFIQSWLFMFLNISAGLCLIPLAKQFMTSDVIMYSASAIVVFLALSGVFNGAGRLVFAWCSDYLSKRIFIICIILSLSLASIALSAVWPFAFGVSILIINACYGAGFSVIPGILADRFGMTNISKIHGAVLSAWGVAGLIGNQVSIKMNAAFGFNGVMALLLGLYFINLINWFIMRKQA